MEIMFLAAAGRQYDTRAHLPGRVERRDWVWSLRAWHTGRLISYDLQACHKSNAFAIQTGVTRQMYSVSI